VTGDANMDEKQKNRDKEKNKYSPEESNLPGFMNKVIVCETLGGKTITGVLTGYNKYELILMQTKDIKSKNPAKTLVYKHGLVSIRELE
jgi:small nuclear ribonucleoprotein (snRNP)-like protein